MISKKDSLKILMVAAEASSATYATELLKHWQKSGVKVQAYGVGSREMEALGFEILGRSEDLAVMGLQEIIAHWGIIKKTFYSLLERAKQDPPDLVLLLDYPEFNLRLAAKMKTLQIPVVYYISPQIWAWRRYRVHTIKKIVDLMLPIFPFEEEFYRQHQVPVEYVGHPLVDLLETLLPSQDLIDHTRSRMVSSGQTILGLMPGSRRSEIAHSLKTQVETANRLQQMHPEIQPVLLVAPPLDMDWLQAEAKKYGFKGRFLKEDPFLMISAADLILCASGTATLMVGLCQKPMVIMYRMNAFTAKMAKLLVRHIPFFGMVNLILGKEAVPERFQSEANPKELARLLSEIHRDEKGRRTQILQSLKELKEKLGAGGGIRRLAEALERFGGLK